MKPPHPHIEFWTTNRSMIKMLWCEIKPCITTICCKSNGLYHASSMIYLRNNKLRETPKRFLFMKWMTTNSHYKGVISRVTWTMVYINIKKIVQDPSFWTWVTSIFSLNFRWHSWMLWYGPSPFELKLLVCSAGVHQSVMEKVYASSSLAPLIWSTLWLIIHIYMCCWWWR